MQDAARFAIDLLDGGSSAAATVHYSDALRAIVLLGPVGRGHRFGVARVKPFQGRIDVRSFRLT